MEKGPPFVILPNNNPNLALPVFPLHDDSLSSGRTARSHSRRLYNKAARLKLSSGSPQVCGAHLHRCTPVESQSHTQGSAASPHLWTEWKRELSTSAKLATGSNWMSTYCLEVYLISASNKWQDSFVSWSNYIDYSCFCDVLFGVQNSVWNTLLSCRANREHLL